MGRVGRRAEVWFGNVVAAFARYVAERVLPLSVPMLMRQAAVIDSFAFAKEHLCDAWPFLDRYEGLTLAIQHALQRFPGRREVLEFGVFRGQMINFQAKRFPRLNFVGFDSFAGLAEVWPGMLQKGAFDLGGRPPRVRRNVVLVKGWFRDSLPSWQAGRGAVPPPLLIHIDCDTYEATCDVLEHCACYASAGMVLHFDDYFGQPNWRNAGHKALLEVAARERWEVRYLCYGTKEVGVFVQAAQQPTDIYAEAGTQEA